MKKLTGSIVALVTPFHEDGSVDFARLRELCDWHIANGTDAILALGTTGETASTSLEEDIKTLECVIDHVNGRVPVIAGAGSNSSEMQKHKSVIYSQMGASALLCISPYYVKTNEEGMYRHFMMSADAATAPIILYNVPGRTGCKISPDVVRRLSVHPNVMAIKEASGDIGYAMKVARYLSDDFTMYSGNDDITIPLMSSARPASSPCGRMSCRAPCTTWSRTIWRAATKRPCRRSCAILTSSTPCSWRSTPSP